jgi:hypothetical protein
MRWMALGVSLLFAASVCVAGAASAQSAQSAQSAAPRADQAVSADLIRLHDDLHLSGDQEAAWRDYATAIAPNPQTLARRRATTDLMPTISTPRRIALIEANMVRDELDIRRQGAAVLAFYGKLTPAQQKIFDQETAGSGPEPQS